MELVAECARNNRASKSKYRKVWKAMVACTEGVLSSGRGVIVEKVSVGIGTLKSDIRTGVRGSKVSPKISAAVLLRPPQRGARKQRGRVQYSRAHAQPATGTQCPLLAGAVHPAVQARGSSCDSFVGNKCPATQ